MKRYKLQIIDKQTLNVIRSEDFDSGIVKVIQRDQSTLINIIRKFFISAALVVMMLLSVIGIILHTQNKHHAELDALQAKLEIEAANYERCSMHAHLNGLIGEAMKSSEDKYEDLTEVYNYIKQSEVWYPEIVMAQFILESGSGTSNVCKEANNYFGMKPARTRDRVNLEGKNYNGYASYKNWKLSVLDRRLWELQWFDEEKPTLQQYKKSLTKYAEDPQYINKLEKIIKEHKVFNI